MAGNLFCSPDTCFQVNRHIGLLFGERLDTLFTSSDSKISGFTCPHVIGFVADLFFSTLESGFIFFRVRCRIRRMRVEGSRIWKEKVADAKISEYVWTGLQIFKGTGWYSGYGGWSRSLSYWLVGFQRLMRYQLVFHSS